MKRILPHLSNDCFIATLKSTSPATQTSTMSPTTTAFFVPTAESASPNHAMWNLVPYDIPWGSDYFDYKLGSLPGPGGECMFLRSPTPVDKRRTVQACKKCRERKAKCSGEHPSCTRCRERGYACTYEAIPKRSRAPASASKAQNSRVHRVGYHPYLRERSDSLSTISTLLESESVSSPSSLSSFSPKSEEIDYADALSGYQPTAIADSWLSIAPPYAWPLPSNTEMPSFDEELLAHCPSDISTASLEPLHDISPHGHIYSPSALRLSHTTPHLHAPKPRRCSNSPSFLSPTEMKRTATDVELDIGVDPKVLSQLPSSFSSSTQSHSASPSTDDFGYLSNCLVPEAAYLSASSLQDVNALHNYCGVSVYSEQQVHENPALATIDDSSLYIPAPSCHFPTVLPQHFAHLNAHYIH